MSIRLKSLFSMILVLTMSQFVQADDYTDAHEMFENAGESQQYFSSAYGYVLFPNIGKAGIGIGGAHGKGKVFVGGKQTGTASMTQVTYGLQLGGQIYSQVIFLEDERSYDEFTSGNFEFGAQATAVAITASAGAQASTGGGAQAGAAGGKNDATTVSGGYRKGMAIFTVAKGGLMYEATLGGQKYKFEAL
ncbi:MAG: YSC84-related protein [Halioglobus sp.]